MSGFCSPATADDRDALAKRIVSNEGECHEHISQATRYHMILNQLQKTTKFTAQWFRLKEEELQFRSQSSIIVLDKSSKEGELDVMHVEKANVTESRDQHIEKTSTDHPAPLKGESPPDLSTNEQAAKFYAGDKDDSILHDISIPSPESNREEWLVNMGRLKSPPARALCNRNTRDNPVFDKITGLLAVEDVCDEPPPVPFILHSPKFKDGPTPKTKAGLEAIGAPDDQGLPIPICVHIADSAIHDKLSRSRKHKDLKSEESACPNVLLASAAAATLPPPADYLNQDQTFPNAGDEQKSRTLCHKVNVDSGLHLPSLLAQGGSKLSLAVTNVLSQSLPNEGMSEQEDPAVASPHELESNNLNRNQGFINPANLHQPRSMHAAVNIKYGLHSTPPATQATSSLPREVLSLPDQSYPNERVHEEVKQDDMIFIPEAFLVEANVPEDGPVVEVAELMELDQNLVSIRKRHVCLLATCIASFVTTLGISILIYILISRRGSNEGEQSESQSFISSLQPSFQPSSQPSLSILEQIERHVLQRSAVFNGSREKALNWIINEDKLQLGASDSNLYQRYIFVLLWYEFMSDVVVDWLSEKNECEWSGVECSDNGFVKKLDLAGIGMSGTIPPEIVGLQYIENITLSNNSLYGTLPSEIGQLTLLTYFDAKSNSFDGPLPLELGNLLQLSYLDLSGNRFTGSIPSEFKYLKALSNFSLTLNEFSGFFPLWIGKLTQITHLCLGNNNLKGSLPSDIGKLRSLIQLDLNSNALDGSLPSEIGNLQELTDLNLWSNNLGGSIPSEIGNLKSLNHLNFGRNSLTGNIPSEIGSLQRLINLDLGDNYLRSSIPSEFGKLEALGSLLLGWCELTGSFPSEIGSLTSLTVLVAAANQLKGNIPTTIGNLKSLEQFEFQGNQLTGSLPSEIGSLASLTFLDVGNNQLDGSIPTTIGNMKSLLRLSLSVNKLVGTIPSEIGSLAGLSELWLFNNKLTGTLPSEIGKLTSLSFFSVGPNMARLHGTVPSELGNLMVVTHFSLGVNNFTGTVPSELGKLSHLKDFLIQGNQFTGRLPSDLKTCQTGLSRLCFNGNNLTDVPDECGCYASDQTIIQ